MICDGLPILPLPNVKFIPKFSKLLNALPLRSYVISTALSLVKSSIFRTLHIVTLLNDWRSSNNHIVSVVPCNTLMARIHKLPIFLIINFTLLDQSSSSCNFCTELGAVHFYTAKNSTKSRKFVQLLNAKWLKFNPS